MRFERVPFTDIFQDVSAGNPKVPTSLYLQSGQYPVIDQGKQAVSGFIDDPNMLFCKDELPVVVFGDHTRCVKFVDVPFAMGADGVKVLKPLNNYHTKYLYHFLRCVELPNAGYSRHFKFLKRITIPLPPLEEQERIAAILDKADDLRQKRQQAIAKLDALLQSVFLDMFGDPVVNPKGWSTIRIKDLGDVVTGNTPSRQKIEYYGDFIEWVKSDNLNNDLEYITCADEYLSESGAEVSRIAPAGSILVTCIAGSPSCIGNLGITNREVAFNQQINAVTCVRHTEFVYALLKFSKRLIQNVSTNSMKGMVSKSRFEQIQVINPPDDLKQDFCVFFAKLYQQKQKLLTQSSQVTTLFSSLQQRAFNGEL